MKVPTTGKECPYFYGDYYRGREHEECRLLSNASSEWTSKDCKACPVPDILLANSCPNMILTGEIKKGLLGVGRKVVINAYCKKNSSGCQKSLCWLWRMPSHSRSLQGN